MASYFSSLLTTTTSRVASIRQNLLPSENDGDTEDDTHICRVLRAYYTEKGRSFPAWLPPDPKAPPPVVVQPVYAQSNVGSRYGGLQSQSGGSSSGFGSLWDKQPAQQVQAQPSSLRQGRGQAGAGRNPFTSVSQQRPAVEARPIPSKMEGSYQSTGFGRSEAQAGPGLTKQERLAGRLGKGFAPQAQRAHSYESSASSQQGPTSANSPWSSSGGGSFDDGGYNAGSRGYDAGGYSAGTGGYDAGGRQGLPSGPGGGRRGPGLPGGPRGYR
ncbi:unnamed protein product [Diplocarpon coronariae]|uniref:Mso1 N-terminal domain-containing protein n=1 Tax=Diplocarpon coronariae TaxID=2795749 RepID=A0A218Z3S5_9HELO|nr:hypothetical protein JHW43_002152 [Diplocarpon mali]OWP01895.1 hypothetical protein B2J93_4745 [Marssonina coronariae]